MLCFALAALELNCSCALLPLCYLLQGSRHQACFFTSELQDVPNSTCCGVGNSPATSSSNRMLWLHTLLLTTSTSQGRFILSETMPRYRALGRKVGLEPTTSKDGEPSILPTELLASKNNYKTIQDIVVGGSSEVHPPYCYSPHSLKEWYISLTNTQSVTIDNINMIVENIF